MVLEDTVKVVVDLKKKKSKKKIAGLFKLIYDGETKYEFKRYRLGLEEPWCPRYRFLYLLSLIWKKLFSFYKMKAIVIVSASKHKLFINLPSYSFFHSLEAENRHIQQKRI